MLPNRAEISSLFSKNFLFQLFSAGAIFLFLLPLSVKAQTNPECPSTYGACPSGQVFIEKKVQNPKTGEFVQVLSGNDATFAPNGQVDFRIEVKNIGSAALTSISVQDQLPGNINFISSSPTGTFESSTRILTWTIDSLGAGESRFFQIVTQVMPKSELNFDIACMTNFVQAQKDQQTAHSFAVFCIQAQVLTSTSTIINNINSQSQSQSQSQTVNVTQTSNVGVGTSGQVLGVTQLPKTGLPAAVWLLSGLVPLGFKVRKFAVNYKSEEGNASYIYQMREFLKGGGEIK